MPGNAWWRQLRGKCHRKQTSFQTAGSPGVKKGRVKRRGKSPPRFRQRKWQGKPHREQGRIGRRRGETPARAARPVPVGWLLERFGDGPPRGMIVAAAEAICLRNRTRLIDDEDRNLAPQKARFCFCLFQQRLAQTCAPGTHASGPFEHLVDGGAVAPLSEPNEVDGGEPQRRDAEMAAARSGPFEHGDRVHRIGIVRDFLVGGHRRPFR